MVRIDLFDTCTLQTTVSTRPTVWCHTSSHRLQWIGVTYRVLQSGIIHAFLKTVGTSSPQVASLVHVHNMCVGCVWSLCLLFVPRRRGKYLLRFVCIR